MLFVNSLSFRYPTEPVECYFSSETDEDKRSVILKSKTLFPKEVGTLFAGVGGMERLYTTYDCPCDGFQSVAVNFNSPENEDFVKRYYNWKLKRVLAKHEELMFTTSGITNDLMVWAYRDKYDTIDYLGQKAKVFTLDRFTLKVRYDTLNGHPYLLIANDRPAQMLGVPLTMLNGSANLDPFGHQKQNGFRFADLNKIMTRDRKADGNYCNRRIDRIAYLQKHNLPFDQANALPILTGGMKRRLGLDSHQERRDMSSKYVKYLESIEWFKNQYLQGEDMRELFTDLSTEFTEVKEHQIGQVDAGKRMLRFGRQARSTRPQEGINYGPAENCPHVDVRLIFIFCESDITAARNLLTYFREGNYGCAADDESRKKRLSQYIGSNVDYAERPLHVIFKNVQDPLPEIKTAFNSDAYRQLNPRVKYMGIYISPIHKHTTDLHARECYYKVKELFMKRQIPTQCIEVRKMLDAISRDQRNQARNFLYTLQNMSVAICAKLGGAPWLLNETAKKELIIGIGAFKTGGRQYIGAAFTFDNTGLFNEYSYFRKSEFSELVGAIQLAIIRYTSVNDRPERLIIHYYKKLSMKREAKEMMLMLSHLGLDIPVYVVSINKTESEDIVLFDSESVFTDRKGTHQSLMPMSGRWANLGKAREGYRFLLCNNTRCEGEQFRATDGFPFPVKLTICCPNREGEIETTIVSQLIEQVYQFSRIYWKSVRQQGLPVTIKYPEMIAEIMPHFNDQAVYPDNRSLWFL